MDEDSHRGSVVVLSPDQLTPQQALELENFKAETLARHRRAQGKSVEQVSPAFADMKAYTATLDHNPNSRNNRAAIARGKAAVRAYKRGMPLSLLRSIVQVQASTMRSRAPGSSCSRRSRRTTTRARSRSPGRLADGESHPARRGRR